MGTLILSDLTKRFDEKLLFSHLSYSFPERGLFLLLGESGSGKTTLFRMIAGLDTDFQGSIAGGGKKNVSIAFQEHRLLPVLSALGNVAEALRPQYSDYAQATAEAEKALHSLGFPKEDFKARPAALSGGMRQRVSLARAFSVKRPILLLDEPEKELDALLRGRLYDAISREKSDRLILVSSHTPEHLLGIADGALSIPTQNP